MRPPATQATESMNDGDQADSGTSERPQRSQFSIFSILEMVAIAATLFAAWRQFPEEAKWVGALSRSIGWKLFFILLLFLVVLLLLVSAATWLIGRTISSQGYPRPGRETRQKQSYLLGVFRFLGLDHSRAQPSVVGGFSIAVASSVTLIFLWPAIRELGLVGALSTTWGFASTREWASYALPDALGDLDHWNACGVGSSGRCVVGGCFLAVRRLPGHSSLFRFKVTDEPLFLISTPDCSRLPRG